MLTEINLLNNDFLPQFYKGVYVEFLQGNHFFIGVSERKGDPSVIAVFERKSFAKRPRGTVVCMGETERNRSNQTALSFVCSTGGLGRPTSFVAHTKLRRCSSVRYVTNNSKALFGCAGPIPLSHTK